MEAPAGVDPLEYVYIGEIRSDSVLIGWGSTKGANTIGRTSPSMGAAEVVIDSRTISETGANHAWVTGLQADQSYPYTVRVGGREIGKGEVRTWPSASDTLTFFVIGDYGNAGNEQYRVAQAMRMEAERAGPVRFILTVGDNIYGNVSSDQQWDRKFFQPYRALLRGIPFYATPGNHDGDENQQASNLDFYRDNFLMPPKVVEGTHTVYSFRFGNLAEFFALDSTKNIPNGLAPKGKENYDKDQPQSKWLRTALAGSSARWKIPYFHHPIYSAGPEHFLNRGVGDGRGLAHWADMFRDNKVAVVFNGHEHNLQYTNPNETDGVRYVVSGAGGKLRRGIDPAMRSKYKIEGWADSVHFLRVSINGGKMEIHPLTYKLEGDNVASVQPVGKPIEVDAR